MKFGIALAAACFALVVGAVGASANEASTASSPAATVDVETGYVTT